MPISATCDLEHDLAAAPGGLGELRECLTEVLEAERVRHQSARTERTIVQKAHDARPRSGGVAEARGKREIVVHEEVAGQLERRTCGRESEEEHCAATPHRTDGD